MLPFNTVPSGQGQLPGQSRMTQIKISFWFELQDMIKGIHLPAGLEQLIQSVIKPLIENHGPTGRGLKGPEIDLGQNGFVGRNPGICVQPLHGGKIHILGDMRMVSFLKEVHQMFAAHAVGRHPTNKTHIMAARIPGAPGIDKTVPRKPFDVGKPLVFQFFNPIFLGGEYKIKELAVFHMPEGI